MSLEQTTEALEETAAGLLAEVQTVVDATVEARERIRELHETEESRRVSAQAFIRRLEAGQVRESLHAAYLNVQEAYEERTAAREALRNAKDAFAVAEANATVEVKMGGGLVEKDPATGKSNKAWIDGQVATMLEKHPDYQAAKKALASAQNQVYQGDMNLDLAQSRLSVARNEARLVAAMLGVGGNNG